MHQLFCASIFAVAAMLSLVNRRLWSDRKWNLLRYPERYSGFRFWFGECWQSRQPDSQQRTFD